MDMNSERSGDEDLSPCRKNGSALLDHNEIHTSSHLQVENDNFLENELHGSKTDIILTKREREILDFILSGHTNKEIAKIIYRSERTVEFHRNRIMQKLGTHNTIELVKCAIKMGII